VENLTKYSGYWEQAHVNFINKDCGQKSTMQPIDHPIPQMDIKLTEDKSDKPFH
jgi:hypothetical protein